MNHLRSPRKSLLAGLICIGFSLGAAAQGNNPAHPAAANADKAATGNASSLSSQDRTFMHKAALGGMTEVQLGKIAQQNAQSDAVKQFGERMVQDHSKANDELKQIAGNKGVQLPASLDSKHQQDVDKLQAKHGTAFDEAYMEHMVQDHQKDIGLFKQETQAGRDADVKGFASHTLPTLQKHLQLAQSTNAQVEARGGSSGGMQTGGRGSNGQTVARAARADRN
jgi:putative membrane protein